jgi:hypothetical protein
MMMKRAFHVLALVLFAGLATSVSQPKLEVVEGLKFSLGSIYRGEVVERKLTLKNVGSDTLILYRVDVSCGCTGTIVSARQIPSGPTGTLLITFNSKNFSGPVHKSVTINSNSKDTPQQIIEFTADVLDELVFTPTQFWFKDAEVGKLTAITMTLKNNGTRDLVLKSFRSTLEGFVLRLPEKPVKPGAQVEIVAEFTPKKAAPYIGDAVYISTSNPHQPEVYLGIFGNAKEFKFE